MLLSPVGTLLFCWNPHGWIGTISEFWICFASWGWLRNWINKKEKPKQSWQYLEVACSMRACKISYWERMELCQLTFPSPVWILILCFCLGYQLLSNLVWSSKSLPTLWVYKILSLFRMLGNWLWSSISTLCTHQICGKRGAWIFF